jgi:NAD+ diphosphatase
MEETGIGLKNIKYFGSQPWPFPDSLMLAYTAEYESGSISIDKKEIIEAGWYSPYELPEVPGPVSVARKLIDWFKDSYGRT